MVARTTTAIEPVARWIAALNGTDLGELRPLCADDLVVHAASTGDEGARGLAQVEGLMRIYHAAFPDGRFTLESIFTEGDLVCCRWIATGTNSGAFLHIPPTNRRVTVSGVCRFRWIDGLITEHWFDFNLYNVFDQLGALLPAPGQATACSRTASRQAMHTWADALRGQRALETQPFREDVVVHAACFQLRATERGRGALERLVGYIRAHLADIEVSLDEGVGQGNTSTYRGTVSGRSLDGGEQMAYRLYGMFRTERDQISECWLRLGRS